MDKDWEDRLKETELPDIKYFHSSLIILNVQQMTMNTHKKFMIILNVKKLLITIIYTLKLMHY